MSKQSELIASIGVLFMINNAIGLIGQPVGVVLNFVEVAAGSV